MKSITCIFTLLLLLSIYAQHSLAGRINGNRPLDVLFLIDGSGSVKSHNFDRLRLLLKDILDKIEQNNRNSIKPTNVALIQFSSKEKTKVEFNLDTFSDIKDMKKEIDNMVYQKKWTYTGYAMEMAKKEVFNGKGGDRPDAKNVILLFTDGHAADPHIAEAATTSMKARGDHVMTVGFGTERSIKRFKPELEAMSSSKDKDVFLKGFDDVETIGDRLVETSFAAAVDCFSQPCLNGGTCETEGDSFKCYCTEEWAGYTCERKKGPCDEKPCLNNGACEETGDSFKCTCIGNFYGDICEKEKIVCTTKNVDILFIMDDSRSIHNKDYGIMKNFVVQLVYRFNISKDQSHVALMQFSAKEKTVIEFHLSTDYRKSSLMKRIQGLIQSDGGETYTDLALRMAREEIFNGKRGDRKDVRDVIVLLTDGQSHNDDLAIEEAKKLRDEDVSIISIGIGRAEQDASFHKFLTDISFGSDYVFKVSFTELDTILDGVTRAACENLQET